MLASIIEFVRLHRAVAKQAVGQQIALAEPAAHTARETPGAVKAKAAGIDMDILDRDPVFEDAMWEYAGHMSTDRT